MKCNISMASSRKYSVSVCVCACVSSFPVFALQLCFHAKKGSGVESLTLYSKDPLWDLQYGTVAKVFREERGVYGGRHQDHPQGGVRLHHVSEDNQGKVRLLGEREVKRKFKYTLVIVGYSS